MTSEINGDGAATVVEKTSKENRSSNSMKTGDVSESHGSVSNGMSNGFGSDKHEHNSSKDKHREKDKHKDRSRDKDKERSKDKDRHSSSGKDRDKSHSSSSKDKEKKSEEKKDREHKSSSSKDKEHHKSSSSSSKDKDKHNSSSKDKEKHSSSSSHRDKDKSLSSSTKEKHSSSSSKDRSKHSSSSSEKKQSSNEDKHKSKDKKSKDKSPKKDEDRHKERKSDEVKVKREPMEEVVKREPDEVKVKLSHVKEEPKSQLKAEPDDSEEEIPLSQRSITIKRDIVDSDDDVPLSARKKPKKEATKKRKALTSDEEDDDDYEDVKPQVKKKKKKVVTSSTPASTQGSPRKKKKEDEPEEVWRWWEEEKKKDGVKWKYLEHLGPMFAPLYDPLPKSVKFSYDGQSMKLSQPAEEVATFYAKMLDHDYTNNDVFNKNFFKDWRTTMTSEEAKTITSLSKCNFKAIQSYFLEQTEKRKAMTKEEKKEIKVKNEEIQKVFGFCMIDGHKEKIGNFRIEPPGLFRGRGNHPKMGMLKKRVVPEQVIINCSKDSKIPKAPEGHKWKEVRHDNSVTWLASWTENVQGQVKYVMLNPSSKLKGEKDWQKYETARELKKCIHKIRTTYQEDWKAKEMMIRQRSVALYFIDKLALRAGNEKDEDQADTVGCCSLRVEHISLQEELGDKKYVVVFDFLGKDSIRYYNEVAVEKRVFKNLQLFMQNKKTGDDLFDRLNTTIMNKHLGELMPGLSAKVFRTYNASITLQEQLNELTEPGMSIQEKILAYNRANRAVAILCNHQRAVPKTHEKSMGNMKEKIAAKKEAVKEAEKQYKMAKKERGESVRNKLETEKKKKALERLKDQLSKLSLQATDKEENKDIALGTSKLNYLDPRISVAWCKKHDVPIDKIYNKTQRSKFNWAIDMATADFVF